MLQNLPHEDCVLLVLEAPGFYLSRRPTKTVFTRAWSLNTGMLDILVGWFHAG